MNYEKLSKLLLNFLKITARDKNSDSCFDLVLQQ